MNSSQQQVWLFQKLNEDSVLLKPFTEHPQVGKICAAPYTEYSRTSYYRARVESVSSGKSKDNVIQVSYTVVFKGKRETEITVLT
jgi:hypothetical protein